MNPVSPPGYSSILAFDREHNRGMGVNESARNRLAAKLNVIYLSIPEFFQAARHYPVVFGKDIQADEYFPLVVTGFREKQNLFIDVNGEWKKNTYIPAYVRRYPFCTVSVRENKVNRETIVIYVEKTGLIKEATPLFNDNGIATDEWQRYETLIQDMESAIIKTRQFCRTLQQFNLMENFEAQAHPKKGMPMSLKGIYRVDEKRLNELPGKVIKGMMKKGELSRIYAHLASLDNFAELLDLLQSV